MALPAGLSWLLLLAALVPAALGHCELDYLRNFTFPAGTLDSVCEPSAATASLAACTLHARCRDASLQPAMGAAACDTQKLAMSACLEASVEPCTE